MHEIGIDTTLLNDILSGAKTVEGRLGKPKFLKIRIDDTITLREDVCKGDHVDHSISNRGTVKVTQLLYFESFDEMFDAVDFKSTIPAADTVAEAIATYRRYYSKEDEHEYGVVAIIFELV